MRPAKAHGRISGFLSCIITALVFAGVHGTSAEEPPPGVWIDIERVVPYAFNKAHISGPHGLSGFARLYGLAPDGSRTALFEASFGRLEVLEALWYADPKFLSLEFEGKDGTGAELNATVSLGPRTPGAEQGSDADASILAALAFPYRLQAFREPPVAFQVMDASPDALAGAAVSQLFFPDKSVWPLVALTAWTILVLGLVFRSRRDASTTAVFIAGAAIAAIAVAATVNDTPLVFSMAMQEKGSVLVRTGYQRGAYNEVVWHDKASGSEGGERLRFLAIHSPLAAAVPVSALKTYGRLRFDKPPLLVRRHDGVVVFSPARFPAAWALHD